MCSHATLACKLKSFEQHIMFCQHATLQQVCYTYSLPAPLLRPFVCQRYLVVIISKQCFLIISKALFSACKSGVLTLGFRASCSVVQVLRVAHDAKHGPHALIWRQRKLPHVGLAQHHSAPVHHPLHLPRHTLPLECISAVASHLGTFQVKTQWHKKLYLRIS